MGGQDNSAQKAAERRERETEARIKANMGTVNQIFDDPARQAQIGDFTNAVRAQYREELDRAKGKNDLQIKFAMARTGQTGGSLDRDVNTDAGQAYQRGLIDVERGAQGDAAALRASDEDARQRLSQLVQAGGDIGTASSNAASTLQNNLLSARSGADVSSFGKAFDSFGDVFSRSKAQSEYRRGLSDYQTAYTPGFGFGGNK